MATLTDIEQTMNALIQARGRLEVELRSLPAIQNMAALQKGIATLCELPAARDLHQSLKRIHDLLNTSISPELVEAIRRFVSEPLPVAPIPGIPSPRSYALSSSLVAEPPAPTPSPTQERRRIGIQQAYERKLGRGQ